MSREEVVTALEQALGRRIKAESYLDALMICNNGVKAKLVSITGHMHCITVTVKKNDVEFTATGNTMALALLRACLQAVTVFPVAQDVNPNEVK